MTRSLPSSPTANPVLLGPNGEDVVMVDVVPVRKGDQLRLTFESVRSDWRQGIWLGTEGILEANGVESPQIVLWHDTSPGRIVLRVVQTDGMLRLYNIWDSGRDLSDHESQSATSGMVIDEPAHGIRRYRCNDIGYDSQFDKLVFTLRVA